MLSLQEAKQLYIDHIAAHPGKGEFKEDLKRWNEIAAWDLRREFLFNQAMQIKEAINATHNQKPNI